MTHLTDEELDALDIMADLQRLVDDEGDVLARASLQYITSLRAQLAELRVERDELRLSIQVKGGTEHAPTQDAYDAACAAIAKHRARADRAEAERAAQIEAADALGYTCTGCGHLCGDPEKDMKMIQRAGGISCCPERKMVPLSQAITHDRTALDRMLAGAEARGYELAKAEAAQCGWHLRRYDLAKRDAELAKP